MISDVLLFQYLYDDYAGTLVQWGQFWAEIARNFKDIKSNLGYNLINEPWVGNYLPDLVFFFLAKLVAKISP